MVSPNLLLAVIIFIFAGQSIILAGMLFFKKPRIQSNIFLSLLVFFFGLMAFNIALVNVLIKEGLFYVFRYVQLELMFGIGPALYFYTKSITRPEFSFSQKDFLHFIPVILEFVFYRTAFYRLGADGMYETTHHSYTKIYLTEQWLGMLSISIYTVLALRLLFQHQRWLKEHYSNLENRSLNWLKAPILIYAIFWIGWQIVTKIDRFLFEYSLKDYYFLPAFAGLAIVTYWIGFKGYLRTYKVEKENLPVKTVAENPKKNEELARKLAGIMREKKPFLDSDLDLTALSNLVEANPKQVSTTINTNFKKNFYEFVNQYRVDAFKQRLHEEGKERLTLLGLALECGFKSKSTFNEVFRKMEGMTPSQYLKNLEKESEEKQSVV